MEVRGAEHKRREQEERHARVQRQAISMQEDRRRNGAEYDLQAFRRMVQEQHDKTEAAGLKDARRDPKARVWAFVRKRPLNANEAQRRSFDVVTALAPRPGGWGGRVVMHEPKRRVDLEKYVESTPFNFDLVFPHDSQNRDVYAASVAPLFERMEAVNGMNATVFAYGQMGSGKTYTISSFYLQACDDIFAVAQKKNAVVAVRFYEIYGGKCFDLLAGRQRVEPREDARGQVCLVGLTQRETRNAREISNLIETGLRHRATGCTSANAQSSRSHSLFEFVLLGGRRQEDVVGKLALVDLAGSECGADRGHTDVKTRQEGAEINKSLLALKECIRALHAGDQVHVPFRGSRLTHILRDAFIGKHSHTVLLAHISPSSDAAEHSLNTLRYAVRLKETSGPPAAHRPDFHQGYLQQAQQAQRPPQLERFEPVAKEPSNRNVGAFAAAAAAANDQGGPSSPPPVEARKRDTSSPESEEADPPTPQRVLEEAPAISAVVKPRRENSARGNKGPKPRQRVGIQPRRAKKRPERNNEWNEAQAQQEQAAFAGGGLERTPVGGGPGPNAPRAPWADDAGDEPAASEAGLMLEFKDAPQPVPPKRDPVQVARENEQRRELEQELFRKHQEKQRERQQQEAAALAEAKREQEASEAQQKAEVAVAQQQQLQAVPPAEAAKAAMPPAPRPPRHFAAGDAVLRPKPDGSAERKEKGKANGQGVQSQFLQTRELAAIDIHGNAKEQRIGQERVMLKVHAAVLKRADSLHGDERKILTTCQADSANGELDAEAYIHSLERLISRRQELDRKLLAQLGELRKRVDEEKVAVKLLDDVFWS